MAPNNSSLFLSKTATRVCIQDGDNRKSALPESAPAIMNKNSENISAVKNSRVMFATSSSSARASSGTTATAMAVFLLVSIVSQMATSVSGLAMPPFHQQQSKFGSSSSLSLNRRTADSSSSSSPYDPCKPTPCGPNTICMANNNGVAVCKCAEGFFPKPDTITGCGPQCESHEECPDTYACAQNKCVNPCKRDSGGSFCGTDAFCKAENHKAICSCPTGYKGDPYFRCYINTVENSLGPEGRTPVVHSGGSNRIEQVQVSSGFSGGSFGGGGGGGSSGGNNNFRFPASHHGISQPSSRQGIDTSGDPCSPSPCGSNTNCRVNGNRAVCSCQYGYYGNPETGCIKGDCLDSNDCSDNRVCREFRCEDPCIGACGIGAECVARRHIPVCQCPSGATGDPFSRCRQITPEELCNPSPCGQNTQCHARNLRAVCSCKPGFFGDPLVGCRAECESDFDCGLRDVCRDYKCINPCVDACGENALCNVINRIATCSCPEDYLGNPQVRCFPECTSHNECPSNRACSRFKCVDPCAGQCGSGAQCRVEDHTAICSCPSGYTGDPFTQCRPFDPRDLCIPSPCGSGAECRPGRDNEGKDRAVCTCPNGFIGDPLVSCRRGECISHSECPSHKACFNYRCEDPCAQGACGTNANCNARNHAAVCSCPSGFTGDPLSSCTERQQRDGRIGQSRVRF